MFHWQNQDVAAILRQSKSNPDVGILDGGQSCVVGFCLLSAETLLTKQPRTSICIN